MMLAGFLPAEIQLRQRTVEFYLRQLAYGRNLLSAEARCAGRTHALSPLDILDTEVARLDRYGDLPLQLLQRVELRLFWTVDPVGISPPPLPSILPSTPAIQRIRAHRALADPELLWIFTDGSVDGIRCGAAAVLFAGSSSVGHPFSVRFEGLHSSTQAELVALHLGCQKASALGRFRRLIIVSDSQPALQATQRFQGIGALAHRAREALCTLASAGIDLQLWWTPAHADVTENEQADAAAKEAAQGSSTDGLVADVPACHTALRTRIRRFYCSRADRQWASSERGRALYSIMPTYTGSISWTAGLPRHIAALVAQFLTGHYATSSYLHRFHLQESPRCPWCEAPQDDREHRLFECPHFEYTRQALADEIEQATQGTSRWSWDYLLRDGRPYLAKFLRGVRAARVPQPEEEDSEEDEDAS